MSAISVIPCVGITSAFIFRLYLNEYIFFCLYICGIFAVHMYFSHRVVFPWIMCLGWLTTTVYMAYVLQVNMMAVEKYKGMSMKSMNLPVCMSWLENICLYIRICLCVRELVSKRAKVDENELLLCGLQLWGGCLLWKVE